jgi:hypothetical protein
LKTMETSLREKYPTRDVRSLLENFQTLANDDLFWNHRTDGLAVLGTSDVFQVLDLQRPVPELVVVANSFHTKPLLRILQSADRFQVLCLGRLNAKLYEGNRDALDPVELTDVPSNAMEALGEVRTEANEPVAPYGGASDAMHHGHGGKADEADKDRARFFRVIDRAILDRHSRPSGLPLILAALPEYHTPFRKISQNPYLASVGIPKNPDALSTDMLRQEAWRALEPSYQERLAKLVDEFHAARKKQLSSDDLSDVARAAVAGKVGTLLVEAERQLPGRIDTTSGAIQPCDLSHPEADDLLDDVAEIVLKMKGDVLVVPAEQMPSHSGIAAIYRYG